MWPLHTALYRYTLTCKLTSCTLEKHTFTCCLQSSTLQTRTVTFLLPPLHSTETHIHMPNTILLYRNTFFHDHCQHCTLKKQNIMPIAISALYRNMFAYPLHTAHSRNIHSQAHSQSIFYRNTQSHATCYFALEKNTHSHAHFNTSF